MKLGRFFQAAVIFSFIFALVAQTVYGISIKSNYDRSYDLARLRTFSFMEQRRSGTDPLGTNTIVANRIRDSLAAQLRAQGFQYQPQGQADFVVAFYAGSKVREQIDTFGYGFPGRWRFGFGPDLWTRYYTVGTAIVDFVDPQNRQLVWRGIASDTVKDNPEDSQKQIDKGAQKLVERFEKDAKKQTKNLRRA